MKKYHSVTKFILQNAAKDKLCMLNLFYSTHNKRRKFSIGIKVKKGWKEENETDELIIAKLQAWRNKVREVEIQLLNEGKDLDSDEVMQRLKVPVKKHTSDNICEFIKLYAEKNAEIEKEKTIYNYTLVGLHLQKFGEDCTFNMMNIELLGAFEGFLLEKKFLNSTVNRLMYSILRIMKIAEQSNIEVHQSYKFFKPIPVEEDNDIVYLEKADIEKLMNVDLPDSIDRARDMFIFSCATGMRYSDVANIQWSNIFDDKISYVSVKTGMRTIVHLNSFSKWVIEKHKDEKRPVPIVSNDLCNKRIKEACERCGIDDDIEITRAYGNKLIKSIYKKWQLIQFHTGRRTFATLMSGLGVPDAEVMRMTGHKKQENFKRYVGYNEGSSKEFMSLWDK